MSQICLHIWEIRKISDTEMEGGLTIETNWNSLNDRNLRSAVNIRYNKSDAEKDWINVDEIVSEESAVLLECETSATCEISLKADSIHNIKNITIVTDCPKIEIFQGNQQEYVNTYFGDILDDFDGIRVYRFDVRFTQSTVRELVIKLFPGIQQFWIYGIMVMMQQAVHPALEAVSKINFQNVQEMLTNSNLKLSPGAEKFLQNYMTNKTCALPPNIDVLNSAAKSGIPFGMPHLNLANLTLTDNGNWPKEISSNGNLTEQQNVGISNEKNELGEKVEKYLDKKIRELEARINQRLEKMEQTQVEQMGQMFSCLEEKFSARLKQIENSQSIKLDKILEILENKKNS